MDEKIEEMAKAIEYAINNDCKLNNGKSCGDCIFDNNGDWNCQNILVATHLFGENYRKESDTAKDFAKTIKSVVWEEFENETIRIKDLHGVIDDILRSKYGVEVEE